MDSIAAIDISLRLQSMAVALQAHFNTQQSTGACLEQACWVGIQTGGVWVAQQLQQQLSSDAELGQLNISFYRDDFSCHGLHPDVLPSELPFNIDGQHVVLVDDVLMTGRTIRAALNELFDYGRPASVTLVVLVNMGRKELPIAADVVGVSLRLSPNQRLKVRGPEPLSLTLIELNS